MVKLQLQLPNSFLISSRCALGALDALGMLGGRSLRPTAKEYSGLTKAQIMAADRVYKLVPPAIPPHLLTDGARDARRSSLHREQTLRRHSVRDLQHQFRADRILELFPLADRHDKSAGAADHTILVIDIKVVDIHGESV